MCKKKEKGAGKIKFLCMLLVMLLMAGCGGDEDGDKELKKLSEQGKEEDEDTKKKKKGQEEDAEREEVERMTYLSDEEVSAMQYVEKAELDEYMMKDMKFVFYGPKDRGVSMNKAYYNEHAITYSAWGWDLETNSEICKEFDKTVETYLKGLDDLSQFYSDIQIGDIVEEKDNRYQFVTSTKTDTAGNTYPVKAVFYLDMQEGGAGVIWKLEMCGQYADEVTNPLIEELASCYGLDSAELIYDAQSVTEGPSYQDEYVVKDGDIEVIKADGYQYLGTSQLTKDDGEVTYDVLTPMGWYTHANENYVSSHMHGVYTMAKIIGLAPRNLDEKMQYYQESTYEIHVKGESEYSNTRMGEIIQAEGKENAYYAIITYDKRSMSDDLWYPAASIEYLQGITEDTALCYEISLSTENFDKYTDIILKELENAYGMDLSQFYSTGEQKEAKTTEDINAQRAVDNAQNKEDAELEETILWFNATYAPLSYSNDGDWRLIGGWEATEVNQQMTQGLLLMDWGIRDRESALEVIESLKKSGHREEWQDYEDELEKKGMLKLGEEEFLEELIEAGIEEDIIRYVLVYDMHRQGISAEDIAAWDLCRVNQLYADAYVCGYLTFEEAMEGSLKNSIILQKKYDSWEEMLDSYMLGYQFWQNDPCVSDTSPTMKRWECCDILMAMEGGPYTLDWDMKLEKCW